MTQLEKSQAKLDRLMKEYQETSERARNESHKIPFGQPNIIGRPDIYKTANRCHEKAFKLFDEIERQKMRIAKLERVEKVKAENELLKDVHVRGVSEYASIGAKTSVNNLDYFRDKLAKLEQANLEAKQHNKEKKLPRAKTYGAEITKLKRKIEHLEAIENKASNQIISPKAQQLIDDGLVTQWKKKPIYYFVKGLKKVALELNETGNFQESQYYYPKSEQDKEVIAELLND